MNSFPSETSGQSGTNPPGSSVPHQEVNRSDSGVVNPIGESVNSDSTEAPGLTVWQAAQAMYAAGLNVVPVRENGTKTPELPSWTKYQRQRTTWDQLWSWFGSNQATGVGVIYGEVSGNVELIEFEGRALEEGVFEDISEIMQSSGLGEVWDLLCTGWVGQSPSGGMHIRVRVTGGPVPKNTKLASRLATQDEMTPEEKELKLRSPHKQILRGLIETRGEGGFGVCEPSHGKVHPSGRPYRALAGGPHTIPIIDIDTLRAVHDVLRMADRVPRADAPEWRGRPPKIVEGQLRPGDDFNERGDIGELLTAHGWMYLYNRGDETFWCRPGKDKGVSATVNYRGSGKLYVFTSSTEFDNERAYSPFAAYAILEHGGKYSEAASALARQGYGDGVDMSIPAPRSAAERKQERGEQPSDNGAGKPPSSAPVDSSDDEPKDTLPVVDISNERDALHNLVWEISRGALPETYVRDGQLVHVGVVSGARNGRRKKEGSAVERIAPNMTASQMRALIAKHMITQTYTAEGAKSKLPTEALCKAILAMTEWHKLPDLVGITTMPFVRPDGTVCQKRGYDPDTGLWLNVDDGFPEVPVNPRPEDVAAARELLAGQLLRDFSWVTPGDLANYLGLLLTPALKQVVDGLSPFGVITAANASSGKSLLTEVISRTYGGNGDATTLSRQDEEIRKLITSKLMSDVHAVVTFDNIGKNHIVDSPVLAQLLTSSVWSDRVLGGNDIVSRVNDKLWLATGNNVRLGGDMASRSVFVRIDPKMERPDKRDTSSFVLGDLKAWLVQEKNRARVIHALLVLIRAWAAAGMPKMKVEMRTFTPWAQTVGGLLDFHGFTGFLSNTSEVDDADDEAASWALFLELWHEKYGSTPMTSAKLLDSYRNTRLYAYDGEDPWQGAFPLKGNDQPHTTYSLGALFSAMLERRTLGWRLRRTTGRANQRLWWPEACQDGETVPDPVQESFPEVH